MSGVRLLDTNALGTRRRDVALPEGGTIAELLEASGVVPASGALLYVDDELVPRDLWETFRPPAGSLLLLQDVPLGGGGSSDNGGGAGSSGDSNKALRTVLSIVVLAAAAYTGGLGGAAISVIGTLAVNAICPPVTSDLGKQSKGSQDSPTLSLTGTSNQARPYSPVPRALGTSRIYPMLAAQPFVEVQGSDQFFRVLYDCGYGPLALDLMKIGETDLSEYSGIDIDYVPGRLTDPPLALFTQSMDTQALTTVLVAGVEHTFTTPLNASEAILDLSFDALVFIDAFTGQKADWSARFTLAYRQHGTSGAWLAAGVTDAAVSAHDLDLISSGTGWKQYRTKYSVEGDYVGVTVTGRTLSTHISAWTDGDATQKPLGGRYLPTGYLFYAKKGTKVVFRVDGGMDISDVSYLSSAGSVGAITITGRTTAQLLKSLRIVFPFAEQWDVKIQRVTVSGQQGLDGTIYDTCTLSALRSVFYSDPSVKLKGHCLISLRIKATDQLHGMLDQFSVVATSLLPCWNGSAWVEQATSNPAWCYAEVLRGVATRRPVADSRLALDDLLTWASDCSANGWECNLYVDYKTTAFELLRVVAATGRCAFGMRDGRYSVVRDIPQNVPIQLFTPRNSSGFSGEKAFVDQPHALRIRYVDRAQGWAQVERIVYADGYDVNNATLFEEAQFLGVTSGDAVWKLGRYHLAAAKLRPEVYTLQADMEHLRCTRGDYVRVQYDVPLWGLGSGRIKNVVLDGSGHVTELTVDELLTLEAGKSYCLRVRLADMTQVYTTLVTTAGDTHTLTPTAPMVGPAQGDLFAFGEIGLDSVACLVRSIEPKSDLSATLTLVDLAPAVHDADTGPIPAFDPQITVPPAYNAQAPAAPVLGVPSTSIALSADGSSVATITVPVTVPTTSGVVVATIQVQSRLHGAPGDWTASPDASGLSGTVVIRGLEPGGSYDVRVRAVGANNLASDWTITTTFVGADALPPATPTGLEVSFDQRLVVQWAEPNDPRVLYWRVSIDDWGTYREVRRPLCEIVNPGSRSGVARVLAFTRSGVPSAEASIYFSLPSPTPPAASDLQISHAWNSATLAVKTSYTRPPGVTGYRWRWTVDGGAMWTQPDPSTGGNAVTLTVPVALFAGALSLTLGCGAAPEDALGVGAWSDTATVTIQNPSTRVLVGSAAGPFTPVGTTNRRWTVVQFSDVALEEGAKVDVTAAMDLSASFAGPYTDTFLGWVVEVVDYNVSTVPVTTVYHYQNPVSQDVYIRVSGSGVMEGISPGTYTIQLVAVCGRNTPCSAKNCNLEVRIHP